MSKMYYTDPLKAAWMAREFGVKLQDVHGKTISELDSIQRYCNYGFTLYIHPDSYSIFEPVEGDKDEDGWIFDWDTDDNGRVAWWSRGTEYVLPTYKQIARRNNTAFFMPEVENE